MKRVIPALVAVGLVFSAFVSQVGASSRYEGGVVATTDVPTMYLPHTSGDGGGGGGICSRQLDRITVDGCPDEWSAMGIKPLITDARGDANPPGLDLLKVFMTNDAEFLYVLMEFAAPPSGYSYLLLNTDGNPNTGCSPGVGFEFGITFSPSRPQDSYIGDARDCGWDGADFPGALKSAVRDNFIEAVVPLKVLRAFGPAQEIEVLCNNDWCEPARYTIKVPVGGAVTGLQPIFGQFIAVCYNLSTGEQVVEFVPSPEWDCKKLGLQFNPGDLVLTGAAGVVPKPK